MYMRCVMILLPHFRLWNAAIRTYAAGGHHMQKLAAFCQMLHASVRPDCFAVVAAAKSCALLKNVGLGTSIHGFVSKGIMGSAPAVGKALMDMYAKFGLLQESHLIFDQMRTHDSTAWNIMLSGYSQSQLYLEAIYFFHLMHVSNYEGAKPNEITAVIILPVCAKLGELKCGQMVHAYVIKIGLEVKTLVGNALLSMYAKCGSVTHHALRMFNIMACKDVVSWNSMISGMLDNKLSREAFDLFNQMVYIGCKPNYATVVNVLPICALLDQGRLCAKEIHCYILRSAMETIISVSNALMIHYARTGELKEAESIFTNMHSMDIVSWNTLISGYSVNGWHWRAVELFHELLWTGLQPDAITLITILPVCANLQNVELGIRIHNYILKKPVLLNGTSVGNALVSFYWKCDRLSDAHRMFSLISDKDLVSWNTMLAAYVDSGNVDGAFHVLHQMHEVDMNPDYVTVLTLLQACTILDVMKLREIHGYSLRAGFIKIAAVGNSIIDAYGKCGHVEHAIRTFKGLPTRNIASGNTMISVFMKHSSIDDCERTFKEMPDRDISTWNVMVLAYALNDYIHHAITFFNELQYQLMRPNLMSIMSILPACARLASVHLVKQCHGYAARAFFNDFRLQGAFLDAYCKCGSVYNAQRLFQSCNQKDLITYTAMVGGYAVNGMAKEALAVFHQMLQSDIKPDHVVITALLSACSHTGLVNEGLKLFRRVDETLGMKPTVEHYACVVDLFARRGNFKEAFDFILGMPSMANANAWLALLGACNVYGEVETGRIVANHLLDIADKNVGNYITLSNIYAAEARWDSVEQVRYLLKTKDLRKPAGCSWIEVDRSRHVFVADDMVHPQRSLIYCTLKLLNREMRDTFTSDEFIRSS